MNYYLLYEVVLLMVAAPSKNGYISECTGDNRLLDAIRALATTV
jgi:hypothetical protein